MTLKIHVSQNIDLEDLTQHFLIRVLLLASILGKLKPFLIFANYLHNIIYCLWRFANKYRVSDKEYRNLVKAYGLKICMSVSGSAGRFDIIPLMQSIGSGIGLMIFSVLISDFLVMYFDKRKSIHDQTDLNFRIKSEEITKFDGFNKIVTVRI